MKLYKLTDANGYTRRGDIGETLWVPGEEVLVEWGGELCDKGCLHAYTSPLVAVFMDPIHTRLLPSGKLLEAEGEIRLDDGTKVGTDKLTIIREIPAPELSRDVRVRTAIYCAQIGDTTPAWDKWAEAWLAGERGEWAAQAAWASVAARAEVWAAVSAARAAQAVASAASAAARAAVWEAARAAQAAASGKPFDLDTIIVRAIEDEEGE